MRQGLRAGMGAGTRVFLAVVIAVSLAGCDTRLGSPRTPEAALDRMLQLLATGQAHYLQEMCAQGPVRHYFKDAYVFGHAERFAQYFAGAEICVVERAGIKEGLVWESESGSGTLSFSLAHYPVQLFAAGNTRAEYETAEGVVRPCHAAGVAFRFVFPDRQSAPIIVWMIDKGRGWELLKCDDRFWDVMDDAAGESFRPRYGGSWMASQVRP